jgi:hypothetical protein
MLTDLRQHQGIPATGQDAFLQDLINAAAALVDGWCNTAFVETTVTNEMHDGAGGRFLKLKHRPVISVTSVALDTSAISTDAYEVDTEQGELIIPFVAHSFENELTLNETAYRNIRVWRNEGRDQLGWPMGTRNIAVSYTYGYSSVPNGVGTACCMVAAGLYQAGQRRGISAETLGPRSIAYGARGLLEVQGFPDSARMLLERYREYDLGG